MMQNRLYRQVLTQLWAVACGACSSKSATASRLACFAAVSIAAIAAAHPMTRWQALEEILAVLDKRLVARATARAQLSAHDLADPSTLQPGALDSSADIPPDSREAALETPVSVQEHAEPASPRSVLQQSQRWVHSGCCRPGKTHMLTGARVRLAPLPLPLRVQSSLCTSCLPCCTRGRTAKCTCVSGIAAAS